MTWEFRKKSKYPIPEDASSFEKFQAMAYSAAMKGSDDGTFHAQRIEEKRRQLQTVQGALGQVPVVTTCYSSSDINRERGEPVDGRSSGPSCSWCPNLRQTVETRHHRWDSSKVNMP